MFSMYVLFRIGTQGEKNPRYPRGGARNILTWVTSPQVVEKKSSGENIPENVRPQPSKKKTETRRDFVFTTHTKKHTKSEKKSEP